MSINLGFYDFFAYLIPGLLYLFVFNEFLRSIGQKFVNIGVWFQSGHAPSLIIVIPILLGAYIVGHLLDPIAHRIFYKFLFRIRKRREDNETALENLKEQYRDLNIQFKAHEWGILFTFIRHRNLDVAHILDKFNADSIMLINIAFRLLLGTFIEIGLFFSTQSEKFLLVAIGAFVLCLLAMFKSAQFRLWFLTDIFEAALEYGVNLDQVSSYTTNKRESITKTTENAKKQRQRKMKTKKP